MFHLTTHITLLHCTVNQDSLPPGRVLKGLDSPNRLSAIAAGVNRFLPETRTVYSVYAARLVSITLVSKLDHT